ncbi:hypothetical protein CEXT_532871 [Caerostris extrusa]|uniref:Uncharacterized protein n=1 Tax=Caerostris extrusa TaxID=172846 RepID=A0AAV4XE12_CAEEX|nr:hypothetical protein CEXT_532871 [Caerostris extrusa]
MSFPSKATSVLIFYYMYNKRISHPTIYPQWLNWRRKNCFTFSPFRSPDNGVMSSLLCAHAGPKDNGKAAEKNGRSRKRPTLMRSGPGRMPFLFQLLNRDVFSLARAH